MKKRISISPGETISLISPSNVTHTLSLVQYYFTPEELCWEIIMDSSRVLSSELVQVEFPSIEGAWITPAVPIVINRRGNCFSLDLILNIGDGYKVRTV